MSLIKNEYTLTVDLKKPTTNIRPRFVQYDTAILYFKVYDNGKDFNFSDQTQIQVAHRKKSGRTEVGYATVVTGKDGKPLIKYEYMGSEMNEVGNITTSVAIVSGSKKVTIQPFVVEILKDIHSGVVDNANKEYSLLQQLITTVESAVKSAIDSANLVKDAVSDAELALDTANLLKESWKYLDAYDLTKPYKKNNVVSYNGSSYIALADNIGKTPVGDINDLNWRLVAKKGTDGNGTVVLYSDTFQGKKGQTVFNLTHEYDQMQNRIHLVVGGIIQHSPLDFMETSSTKVTLNYPLEDDMRVVAVYFGEAPAITNDLQVQIDSIKEIVQVFDLVEVMNKGDYAKAQGDYAKQQGDIAKTNASEALLAKQATETATSKVTTAISDLNQLKSTLNTSTNNANTATQRANEASTQAVQSANNAQLVADNTVSVGTFVLSKAYKKNNLVLDNGTTWMAIKDTIFNPVPILPTRENEFWRLVAQRGVDGTGSVSSVNGVQPNVNGDVLIGVPQVEGLQESLDELQTFIKKETFVSTEGQTVFNLTLGAYLINENRISVEIGGVEQFSPTNFIETNETTITINEPLNAGSRVVVTYYSDFHPIRTDVEGRLIALEDDLSNVKVTSNETTSQVTTLSAEVNKKYVKPTTGVPQSDLASDVQTSLSKADSALQSVPDASTTVKGVVQLNDTLTSTSTTLAATANQAKVLKDLVDTKASNTDLTSLNNKVTQHLVDYATTQDVTYYVNDVTGNDSNNGLTSSSAFKTITKVVSMLPQIINHKVTVEIVDGTYNEDLKIEGKSGRGEIIINGATSLTTTHNVKSVIISHCPMSVTVRGLNTTNTTGDTFLVVRSNSAYIVNCKANTGFAFADTKASVKNSNGSNSLNGGITAFENSIIFSENNIGSNNQLQALARASILYVSGSLPSGNNPPLEDKGGLITNSLTRKKQEAYIPAVLENGWSVFDPGDTVGYYKDEFNIVRLTGRIKGGSIGIVSAFTLPQSYRLKKHAMFRVNSDVHIYILDNGKVCVYSGTNADVWLDGITFRAVGD